MALQGIYEETRDRRCYVGIEICDNHATQSLIDPEYSTCQESSIVFNADNQNMALPEQNDNIFNNLFYFASSEYYWHKKKLQTFILLPVYSLLH